MLLTRSLKMNVWEKYHWKASMYDTLSSDELYRGIILQTIKAYQYINTTRGFFKKTSELHEISANKIHIINLLSFQ